MDWNAHPDMADQRGRSAQEFAAHWPPAGSAEGQVSKVERMHLV